ncbi:MAG TPA: beta-ketoacyl-ACP synthase II [Chloroflexota bacterium]|nr:beta-ketoacyl-ACP synthase II [Chloroflexota bacterium]
MSERQRVVITGLGILCPVGIGHQSVWENLLAGRSGVARITHFDPSPFPVHIGGEVKGFDPASLGSPREVRRMDRCTQLALAASLQAVADADLDLTALDPESVGITIGSAAGGFQSLLEQHQVFLERGPRRVSPFFIQHMLVDSPAGQVAISLGLRGPNMAVVSACATGTQAIGEGAEAIRRGDAAVMLAGGTEAPIHPVILAGFSVMHALARDNEQPERASSPFTKRRDGFVLSEGAAVVVLESLEHARARGARVYAEVGGYGATNDAYDMAAVPEDGAMAAQTMRRALRKSGLAPEDIDYINAHGTGTPLNDKAETLAIKSVFGDRAYRMAVSSTKSMTGHMMGASGAVEAVVCALALRDGIVPPTINLDDPDPECDLDYVPHTARRLSLRATLSNSFGLGGHNASIVLRQPLAE